jgi:hypothetical protein
MSSKKKSKKRRRKKERAREQREAEQNSPPTPPPISMAPIESVQEVANSQSIEDQPNGQNYWRRCWACVVNPSRRTLVIAEVMATVAIATFAGFQVYYGNKQWNAAEVSNELSRDTAKKQLRAYLTTAGWLAEELADEEVAYTVLLKNSGVTLANKVVINSWICIEDRRFNGPFDFSELAPGRHISTSVFGPGITSTHTKSIEVSADDRKAIECGKKAIWFYGEIRYLDVFKETHRTQFRFIGGGRAGTTFDKLVFAQEGNEAN